MLRRSAGTDRAGLGHMGGTLNPSSWDQGRLPERGDAYTGFSVGVSFEMTDFLNLQGYLCLYKCSYSLLFTDDMSREPVIFY